MFLNYANSPQDLAVGYMDKSSYIKINSCGTYRLFTRNRLETCRPQGRNDYQLIYIASGRGYFYFANASAPTIVEAGNMVLYRPEEFQKYEYYGKDHASIYWIHFTGHGIAETFCRYGLNPEKNVFVSGVKSFYAQVFEQIILELHFQKEFYEESAALLLTHIIMMAGRYQHDLLHDRRIPLREVEDVMLHFREHYHEDINIESFVKERGYGVRSFYRNFKKHTGLTLLQYLLEVRLANAIKLLETTNFQINEIARLVGYENALYFSRLFRRHTGVSPKEYRNAADTVIL